MSYKHALDLKKYKGKTICIEQDEPLPSFLYELQAVVIHKGRELDHGHYVALTK